MHTKLRLKLKFVFITFGMLLVGCSQQTSPAPTTLIPLTTPIPITPSLIKLTATAIETPTKVSPTGTPEVELRLQDHCLTVTNNLDNLPEGVLVMRDAISNELWLLNVRSGKKTILDKTAPFLLLAVSPDFKQLAYLNTKSGPLQISDSRGKILKTIPLEGQWQGVMAWNDLQSLLLAKFLPDSVSYPPVNTVLYKLTTGEFTEYKSNYPGLDAPVPPRRWKNFSQTNAIFNPNFTQVIYPIGDQNGQPYLVVWDLIHAQELLRLAQGYDIDYGGYPRWLRTRDGFLSGLYPRVIDWNGKTYDNSKDGLPYKGGYDLFEISTDGKLKRLTYLSTKFTAGEEEFSLSPNEDQIAFWLNLNYQPRDERADRKLSVLNVASGKIENLCFSGGGNPTSPLWSPDGRYLAVTLRASIAAPLPDKHHSETYLIDLQRGIATKLSDDMDVEAWLMPVSP